MSTTAQSITLNSESTLPSWFKPARFLDDTFDAESYVTDLRRFVSPTCGTLAHSTGAALTAARFNLFLCCQVPLEALSSQLQAYLKVLNGKLVEVINEDYNDFVSLSTKLVNVDGAVTQMQRPLLVLKVIVICQGQHRLLSIPDGRLCHACMLP